MSDPIFIGVTKWRRAPRGVEPPKQSKVWMGGHYYQAYQVAKGGSDNKEANGHKRRWYVDRAWRKALGKHGLYRLRNPVAKEAARIAALKTKAHGQADLIKGIKV